MALFSLLPIDAGCYTQSGTSTSEHTLFVENCRKMLLFYVSLEETRKPDMQMSWQDVEALCCVFTALFQAMSSRAVAEPNQDLEPQFVGYVYGLIKVSNPDLFIFLHHTH